MFLHLVGSIYFSFCVFSVCVSVFHATGLVGMIICLQRLSVPEIRVRLISRMCVSVNSVTAAVQ